MAVDAGVVFWPDIIKCKKVNTNDTKRSYQNAHELGKIAVQTLKNMNPRKWKYKLVNMLILCMKIEIVVTQSSDPTERR